MNEKRVEFSSNHQNIHEEEKDIEKLKVGIIQGAAEDDETSCTTISLAEFLNKSIECGEEANIIDVRARLVEDPASLAATDEVTTKRWYFSFVIVALIC